MHAPVYEETHNGHQIKIHHDRDAESPRDWDNLGTMICRHSRYSLGDKHEFDNAREFLIDLCGLSDDSELSTSKMLDLANRKAVILPVFLYDHSGLAMNTTGFHCPWDSGQVGFIYATLKAIRAEHNVSRVSTKLRECIADHLCSEVETYNDYLGGNVYGYTVEKDGEDIDSCWGFIGDYDGYCLKEARSSCT